MCLPSTTLPILTPRPLMHNAAPIGLLGGTFDPLHLAHLRLAIEAREILGLAEVRFIPAGAPPLRAAPCATPAQRLDMVKQGIAGDPGFSLRMR